MDGDATWPRASPPAKAAPSASDVTAFVARQVVTNLSVQISPSTVTFSDCGCKLDPRKWYLIEKELCLNQDPQQNAWLYVEVASQGELAAGDLVVTDIKVGEVPPCSSSSGLWTSCKGGLWVQRRKFSGNVDQVVTALDVLFGKDAVDPRPQWVLMQTPLQLGSQLDIPVARLTVLRGRAKPRSDFQTELRVPKNGEFKIVQISDMHLTTGVGLCSDGIDADGKDLPNSEADPQNYK